MGNSYSVVRDEEEEAEFRVLLEAVEIAQRRNRNGVYNDLEAGLDGNAHVHSLHRGRKHPQDPFDPLIGPFESSRWRPEVLHQTGELALVKLTRILYAVLNKQDTIRVPIVVDQQYLLRVLLITVTFPLPLLNRHNRHYLSLSSRPFHLVAASHPKGLPSLFRYPLNSCRGVLIRHWNVPDHLDLLQRRTHAQSHHASRSYIMSGPNHGVRGLLESLLRVEACLTQDLVSHLALQSAIAVGHLLR